MSVEKDFVHHKGNLMCTPSTSLFDPTELDQSRQTQNVEFSLESPSDHIVEGLPCKKGFSWCLMHMTDDEDEDLEPAQYCVKNSTEVNEKTRFLDDDTGAIVSFLGFQAGGVYHEITDQTGGSLPDGIMMLVLALADLGLERCHLDDTFILRLGEYSLRYPVGWCVRELLKAIHSVNKLVTLKINGVVALDRVLIRDDVVTLHPIGVGGKPKGMPTRKNPVKPSKKPAAAVDKLAKAISKMTTAAQKPKKRSIRRGDARGDNSNEAMLKWKMMSYDAFNPKGFGAKYVGAASFPTNTFSRKGIITLVNPAGTGTSCAAMMGANPFFAYVDLQSLNGGASTTSVINASAYASNGFIWQVAKDFSTVANPIRIVGVGWRIKLNTAMTTVTGRMIFAPMPHVKKLFGYGAASSLAMTSGSDAVKSLINEADISVVNSSALLNLPGAFEVALQDMIGQDVYCRSKHLTDDCLKFRNVNIGATYNATSNVGADIYTTSTGTVSNAAIADIAELAVGFNDWFLYGYGLANDASKAIPIVEIEYVYHIEGTPAITSTSNTTLFPSGQEPASGYNRQAQDAMWKYASELDWYTIAKGAGNIFTNAYRNHGNPRLTNF